MAGTILSPNQIAEINAAYPRLVAYIRELLEKDQSGYGLMNVHESIETLNTDGLYQLFSTIKFVSPSAKRALVRAAVYEVLIRNPEKLTAVNATDAGLSHKPDATVPVPLKSWTPPQFNLNPATTETLREVKAAPIKPPVQPEQKKFIPFIETRPAPVTQPLTPEQKAQIEKECAPRPKPVVEAARPEEVAELICSNDPIIVEE